MESEMLRFEYRLSYVPLEDRVWTSLQTITERLHTGWQPNDERALSDTDATYRETMAKLEAAERNRNRAALEGPVKDAGRDPEFGLLCAAFAKSNDELDLQFRALRLRWPDDGINP